MPENGDKLIIIRGSFRESQADFSDQSSEKTFRVCFNPAEYTIDKQTEYSEISIPGLDSPLLQFHRGRERTLSMELLLDTVAYGSGEDVRTTYLAKLQSFMMVDGELHAPPPCKIVWGSLVFMGVLTDLRKRYTLFLDDGTPVRARVLLLFKELLPVRDQIAAAPRASPDRRKVHTLKAGESLWHLSYEAYGDARKWRLIADANRIDNPRQPAPGTLLVLPALDQNANPLTNNGLVPTN